MNARKKVIAVAVSAGFGLSCVVPQLSLSSLQNGIPSPDISVDSSEMVNAAAEAEAKCAALEHQEVTYDEELALGGAVALNWASRGGGLYADRPASGTKLNPRQPKNALNAYVATVGKNLAAQSSRPGLRWTFGVLDSPAVNAYSAPGGYVMVTRGLLEKIDNEAQLAGVLAHEIAHINEKHALKAYQRIRAAECKAAVWKSKASKIVRIDNLPMLDESTRLLDAAVLGPLTDLLVEALLNNGYENQQEHGADAEAADLMTRAGYNPFEYVAFLGKIPDGAQNYGKHPARAERQKNVGSVIAALADDELLKTNGKKLEEYAVLPNRERLAAATPTEARTER